MKTKKNFLIILSLIILLIIIFLFEFYNPLMFPSPDENAFMYFIGLQANEGKLFYEINNSEFGDLIHTRSSINFNNKIVPMTFLGEIILRGSIITIPGLGLKFNILLDLITRIILITYLYLISKLIFHKQNSIFYIPTFLIITLVFISISNYSITFFIISLYYYIKFIYLKKTKYSNLFAFFGIICLICRYDYLIFFIPLFIFEFYNLKENKKLILYQIMIFFIIGSTIILLQNNLLYGNSLSTGYSFDYQARLTSLYFQKSNINKITGYILPYGINIPSIIDKSSRYIFILFPFSIFVLLGLILCSKSKEYLNRKFIYLFLIIFVITIVYYGSNPYFYGYATTTFYSSYVRYFLLIYILGSIFLIPFLSSTIKNKKIIILLIFIILTSGIISECIYYIQYNQRLENYNKIKNNIINLTNEDSVIFTYYWDKVIWPERLTATSSRLLYYEQDLFNIINKNIKNRNIYVFEDSIYYTPIRKCYNLEEIPLSLGMKKIISFKEECNESKEILPDLKSFNNL